MQHGMFYDNPGYREGYIRQHNKSRIYGYFEKRKLTGYIIFNFKQVDSDNFIHNEIHVDEWVSLSREAFSGIASFLRSQQDQIDKIQYLTFDGRFDFCLHDPRNDSGNFYPSVFHETNTQASGIMYRVINTELLFQQMSDRQFGIDRLTVKFDIQDSFLPENNKPVVVHFENGFPTLLDENSKADVTLTVDISDFSSMILGAVGFNDLYRYGLVRLSDDSYVETMQELLHTGERPICLTHF